MRARRRRTSVVRQWKPSVVRLVLRQPLLYWSIALVAAAISAYAASQAVPDPEATVDLWVTTTDVEAGEPLLEAAHLVEVPARLAPERALVELGAGDVATRALSRNVIVTTADAGTADPVAADEATVALPVGPTTPTLRPGAAVLVVVHSDPLAPAEPTVEPGRVIAVDDEQVMVAVHVDVLVDIAAAVSRGTASLAVSG